LTPKFSSLILELVKSHHDPFVSTNAATRSVISIGGRGPETASEPGRNVRRVEREIMSAMELWTSWMAFFRQRALGFLVVAVSGMVGCTPGNADSTPDGAALDGTMADGAIPFDGAPGPDTGPWDGSTPGDGSVTPDGQVAEVCNGLDDDGDGLVDEGLESFCGPCGRPYDLTVTAPYPIHANWMYDRSACDWQNTLEAFHRQGGQAVWQFGPAFEVHTAQYIRSDPNSQFTACTQGSQHCVDAALADLQAVNASNTVANYLTYGFRDVFTDAIMACPALDRKITVGARTYWRLVLPHSASQAPCDFNGGSFDILFAWAEGPDARVPLLRVADGLQMDVFMLMPTAPPLAGQTWTVDTALRPAFLEWSRRVLENYAIQHGGHPSFVGVYQSFEVPLKSSGLDAVYDTYGALAGVIHTALPGKIYALSPYWNVRVDGGNDTVASVRAGFKRLARLGVDLIAPQDGRGAGGGALYWPYEETVVIADLDPRLADNPHVVGTRTFSQEFNASTLELFAGLRNAVTELDSQEGISVTLWANVEAFETILDPTSHPGDFDYPRSLLVRTNKERMDWALTFAGAYPTRILSFMWDPFYITLDGGYTQSLHQEIVSDFARPIAAEAFFWNGGIVVRGFHLSTPGTTFNLTWFDSAWAVQSASVISGSTDPGWGAAHDRSPLLDEIWFPFDSSNLANSFFVHITPVGPGNLPASHVFSLAY